MKQPFFLRPLGTAMNDQYSARELYAAFERQAFARAKEMDVPLLRETLRALEGSTDIVDCVGSDASVCEKACTCSARPLFLKLQCRINAVLEETTIGELTEDHIEQKKRIEHARIS